MTLVLGQSPYSGRLAGRYRLLEQLGEGGMGAVFLAEHVSLPGSRKVVKLLLPDSMNNKFVVEHFGVEARTAASLHHPNIIAVDDVGNLDTGEPYIAMEYLKGTDVNALCKKHGALPLPFAAQIILQACSALQAAHSAGIVHRDIKPHNLFVVDGTGILKVLDFGIAKAADPSVAGGARTETQQVSGSPGFMSPEQARGLTNVDHRGDIFSLAATLYLMVTGRLPFAADSFPDYLFQLGNKPPLDPQLLRADLPNGWKYTILQGLAIHAHERPASMAEFGQRLIGDVPGTVEIANNYAADLVRGSVFERPSAFNSPSSASGDVLPSGASASVYAAAVHRSASVAQGRARLWLGLGAVVLVGASVALALVAGRGSHDGNASAAASGAPNASQDARAAALAPVVDAAQVAITPVDAGAVAQVDPVPVAIAPADANVATADASIVSTAIVDAGLPSAASTHVGSGSLEVYVEPWALVQIDGHAAGQTPVTKALAVGTHKLLLSNPDSGKQERVSVTIRAGRTTTIERKW